MTAPSSSSSSTSSSVRTRPPALTDDEKQIIQKFHGCFKCRILNVNHVSENCPNDFPSGVNYKPVTAPSSSAPFSSKPSYSRPNTVKVATVSDLLDITNTPTVMVGATTTLSSGENYSDSDDKCVDPSLQSSSHIIWPAVVHSPASLSSPIEMLIDNSCTTVLIRDDVITRLGLRRWKMYKSFPMGVAWGKEKDGVCEGVEYVNLKISSPDMSFTACVVGAIIVPDLFVPIFLGLP